MERQNNFRTPDYIDFKTVAKERGSTENNGQFSLQKQKIQIGGQLYRRKKKQKV